MKPASPHRSKWANKNSVKSQVFSDKVFTTKKEKEKEPFVLCRIIPPVVALIPDLLDTPVPRNYSPEQAIDLLTFKIKNRLLL